ncbi:MAG: hypothetical protein HY238_14365 [Acidobacteria bacterium]|nr:hypothetical protein [Acidobacteriota bacterium]
MGGTEFRDDFAAYGPARYFAVETVAQTASELSRTDLEEEMKARFDAGRMSGSAFIPRAGSARMWNGCWRSSGGPGVLWGCRRAEIRCGDVYGLTERRSSDPGTFFSGAGAFQRDIYLRIPEGGQPPHAPRPLAFS